MTDTETRRGRHEKAGEWPADCRCGSWLMDGFVLRSCPVRPEDHPDATDNDGAVD